ncbi:MAG: MATE family efflux transporter, partial [bacterium]|nr:MATE family efflux transporter [bacterium]
MKEKRAKLTEGSIPSLIIKLTLGNIIGILGMVAFNITDMYFVSRLGTVSLAAISFTFPVVLVINSLGIGLGIGASALISVTIGEGDHHKVQRLTTDAMFLAISMIGFLAVIGYFTIEPLFTLLGAEEEILPLIKQYMKIWYCGMPLVVVTMVGNHSIRATGDTYTPSMIMLVSVCVNIILDPIFIFGWGPFPKMGVAGAALTTVFSRAVLFLTSSWILYHREKMITFEKISLNEMWSSWKRILYIGIPTAGSRMIIPISTGIITGLIATYGTPAVAAYGVASRIEFFAFAIFRSISVVIA